MNIPGLNKTTQQALLLPLPRWLSLLSSYPQFYPRLQPCQQQWQPIVQQFWDAFKATRIDDVDARFFEVCVFDDNEPSANHLAALVVRGIKRSTAGLVWSFEAAHQAVPKPGDLSVVTTWDGQPVCVIETTQVDITPFCEVTAEFAAAEGEGDGSLQYWREVHTAYYASECARLGRVAGPLMPVACERFKVVYALS